MRRKISCASPFLLRLSLRIASTVRLCYDKQKEPKECDKKGEEKMKETDSKKFSTAAAIGAAFGIALSNLTVGLCLGFLFGYLLESKKKKDS